MLYLSSLSAYPWHCPSTWPPPPPFSLHVSSSSPHIPVKSLHFSSFSPCFTCCHPLFSRPTSSSCAYLRCSSNELIVSGIKAFCITIQQTKKQKNVHIIIVTNVVDFSAACLGVYRHLEAKSCIMKHYKDMWLVSLNYKIRLQQRNHQEMALHWKWHN